MRIRENSLLERIKNIDLILIFTVISLSIYGIIVVSTATNYLETSSLVITQIFATLLGAIAMIVFMLVDYEEILRRMHIPIYFCSLFLLILPVIKSIPSMLRGQFGNNDSWIEIPGVGFNLQPSEIVKILFIMTFAYHIANLKNNINSFKSIISVALHAGIIWAFVMLEMDLGAGIIFACIILLMCFIAGISLWYFAAVGVVIGIALPFLWNFLSEYQQMRILVGFDPYQDPEKYGYQVIQSMKAITNGGLMGCGYGNGPLTQNPNESVLPARQTDMIFAVIGEEFGFIGLMVFFVLITILIARIIYIARNAPTKCGSYICMGVAAVFIFQTLENVGMCLGLLPVIGITLPFMSYGGSSVVALYLCIGAVLSVASNKYPHKNKLRFEGDLT